MKALFQHSIFQSFLVCLSISGLWWLSGYWHFAAAATLIFFFSLLSAAFRGGFLFWFNLAMRRIGRVKSALLLGIIYFAVLVPIALFMRIFSKKAEATNSNWQSRNHQVVPTDFEKMW
ncbi:MAG: hypothetical protein AAF206_18940 [Bacteroidota bacterium]